MPFPPEAAFNPEVNKIPVLDASSGNPKSFQDPKSVASIGSKIQAMTDQAQADTLYDSTEGFRGRYRLGGGGIDDPRIAALTILGIGLIIFGYFK